jgi:hypothetical protein
MNEGLNGFLKDGAWGCLDDPERRRVRGTEAQTRFTAFQALAVNIRMIDSFLARSRSDQHGVRRLPRRRKTESISQWRQRTPARSGSPLTRT